MNCEETRQNLSRYLDQEIDPEGREALNQHFKRCSSCRKALDEQGALDMLIKKHFSTEPPSSNVESIWPTVSEQLDNTDSTEKLPIGGGGAPSREEVYHFKSSPSMQILTIPEARLRKTAVTGVGQAAESISTASPWRWPVALIVSSIIVVAGFLAYKKITPPADLPLEATSVVAGQADNHVAQTTKSAPAGEGTLQNSTAVEDPRGQKPTDPDGIVSAEAAVAGVKGKPAIIADDDEKVEKNGVSGESKGEIQHRQRPKFASTEQPKAHANTSPQSGLNKKTSQKAEEDKPVAGKTPEKKNSLESLIDEAVGGGAAIPPQEKADRKANSASEAILPDQLNMNQIRNAMQKIKGLVQSCYDQFQVEGLATVRFSIEKNGLPSDVTIRGKFFGTDTGDCVVNAVKKARFPKFKGSPIHIKGYPFRLQ